MLQLTTTDHRRFSTADLLTGIRAGDALALAESYARTVPAAHACARRLLGGSDEVEELLRQLYAELWAAPPEGVALESWVRGRAFALGAAHLRAVGRPAAVPSAAGLLADLGTPEVRYLDAAERALAELDDASRTALVVAHDRGVATVAQEDPSARAGLVRALELLAGPEPGGGEPPPACEDVPLLADHVLGLVADPEAAQVQAVLDGRSECAARARMLRRGRRKIEGLPPTPDLGQRVIAFVLADAPARGGVVPSVASRPEGPGATAEDPVEDPTEDLGSAAVAAGTGIPPDPDPLITAAEPDPLVTVAKADPLVTPAEADTGEVPAVTRPDADVAVPEVHPVAPSPAEEPVRQTPSAPTEVVTEASSADEPGSPSATAPPEVVEPQDLVTEEPQREEPAPPPAAERPATRPEAEAEETDDRPSGRPPARRRGRMARFLGYVLPIVLAAAIGWVGVLLLVNLL